MSKNRFRDLFIKPDEEQQVETSTVEVRESKQEATAKVVTPKVKADSDKTEEIYNELLDHILEHNLPGPDYLELKSAMRPLEKYIKDEDTRIQAAYDSLKEKYTNLKKENITSAIDEYIRMITKEQETRLKEMKDEESKKLSGLTSDISVLSKEALEEEKQIKELEKSLEKKRAKINKLESDKAALEEEHDKLVSSLMSGVTEVVSMLSEDKKKIESLNLN